MSVAQKFVLIIGTALTIYFLTFAPFTKQVAVKNPNYTEGKTGGIFYNQNRRYIYEDRVDYSKKTTFAISSVVGTAVLFFVLKPKSD